MPANRKWTSNTPDLFWQVKCNADMFTSFSRNRVYLEERKALESTHSGTSIHKQCILSAVTVRNHSISGAYGEHPAGGPLKTVLLASVAGRALKVTLFGCFTFGWQHCPYHMHTVYRYMSYAENARPAREVLGACTKGLQWGHPLSKHIIASLYWHGVVMDEHGRKLLHAGNPLSNGHTSHQAYGL